jgi:hypothetical protein
VTNIITKINKTKYWWSRCGKDNKVNGGGNIKMDTDKTDTLKKHKFSNIRNLTGKHRTDSSNTAEETEKILQMQLHL